MSSFDDDLEQQREFLASIGWSPASLKLAVTDNPVRLENHNHSHSDNNNNANGGYSDKTPTKRTHTNIISSACSNVIDLISDQNTSANTPLAKQLNLRTTPVISKGTTTFAVTNVSSSALSLAATTSSDEDIQILSSQVRTCSLTSLTSSGEKSLAHTKLHLDVYPTSASVLDAKSSSNTRKVQSPIAAPPPPPLAAVVVDYYEVLMNNAKLNDPLPNGWSLYEHQKQAIRECLRLQRSILAYDMGLGKTMIGLKWAHAVCSTFTDCFAVVIAPCTLLETWRRESVVVGFSTITSFTHAITPLSICTSSSASSASVHNADAHGSSEVVPIPAIAFSSWAKVAQVIKFVQSNTSIGTGKSTDNNNSTSSSSRTGYKRFVVIADEAHAMQNMTSDRTKAMLTLCCQRNCVGCILSTGTPMKNGRPANIYPLLAAIQHPVAKNKLEFEKRYCNARKTKFCAWDVTGAANLEELKERIGPFMLRKTKEDCLDLPAVVREKMEVSVRREFVQQYEQLAALMATSTAQSAGSMYQKKDFAPGGSNFEVMSKIRQLSSLCKVEGTGECIANKLAIHRSGTMRDPFVVFVWYKATAKLLKRYLEGQSSVRPPAAAAAASAVNIKLVSTSRMSNDEDEVEWGNDDDDDGEQSPVAYRSEEWAQQLRKLNIRCEILTGELSQQERQEIVDEFQEDGGSIDVIICTYGVGSTGLTLTRSHDVILLDRPWTPGDVLQAEDRVRRIGQRANSVSSGWVWALPHDDKLDAMLRSKDLNSGKVVYRGGVGKSGWFDTTTSSSSSSSNNGSGAGKGGGIRPKAKTAAVVSTKTSSRKEAAAGTASILTMFKSDSKSKATPITTTTTNNNNNNSSGNAVVVKRSSCKETSEFHTVPAVVTSVSISNLSDGIKSYFGKNCKVVDLTGDDC